MNRIESRCTISSKKKPLRQDKCEKGNRSGPDKTKGFYTCVLELIRRSHLHEASDVRVQRLVITGLIEFAVGKERIERRRAVEDVVDAAVDRPVLEACVRHHEVELAIRPDFVRRRGIQSLISGSQCL